MRLMGSNGITVYGIIQENNIKNSAMLKEVSFFENSATAVRLAESKGYNYLVETQIDLKYCLDTLNISEDKFKSTENFDTLDTINKYKDNIKEISQYTSMRMINQSGSKAYIENIPVNTNSYVMYMILDASCIQYYNVVSLNDFKNRNR